MTRSLLAALFVWFAAAPPIFAQASFAQGKPLIVTTSADLKALVEMVGGSAFDVESIASPEQDPHAIEVKPGQLSRLKRAALLVKIGLDHEPWLARFPPGPGTVLDTSKSARLLQTETPRLRVERKAHVHAFGNTHFWLDPRNAEPMTAAILASLAGLAPGDKAVFETRRSEFLARLNARIGDWEAALLPYRGTKIVVVHDSWTYFADRFGLQIVAAAEPHPGIPPSPAELAALFKRMRESGVKILVSDPHANPGLVRQIVEKTQAKSVTLRPSGTDYIELFEGNVKRLLDALK